jgi:hypothetical protein
MSIRTLLFIVTLGLLFYFYYYHVIESHVGNSYTARVTTHHRKPEIITPATPLFEEALLYRFGEGENQEQKNQPLARAVYTKIISCPTSTPVEKSKARMYLKDLIDEEYQERENAMKKSHCMIKGSKLCPVSRPKPRLQSPIIQIPTRVPETAPQGIFFGDKQNTHDPIVVRTAKASLQQLKDPNPSINKTQNMLFHVRQLCSSNPSAEKAFFKLQTNTDKISSFGMTELEILEAVYDRMNDPVNKDRKADMETMLIQQLADGETVCAMGRATRVLQTLEGTDLTSGVAIKPEWAIKEEMNGTASKVYNDYLAFVSPEIREVASADEDTLNPEKRKILSDFKLNYGNRLQSQFNLDYVAKGILTEEYTVNRARELVEAV